MKTSSLKITTMVLTLFALSACEKIEELKDQASTNDDSIFGSIFGKDEPEVMVITQKSFDDYLEEAEEGDKDAQFVIAERYYYGEGVPRDYIEAVRWYRLAGQQGHLESQFHLAKVYYKGIGAAEDKLEAYAWVNLAASQGHEKAMNSRDKLEKHLTTYEIRRAQERSGELFDEISNASVSVNASR